VRSLIEEQARSIGASRVEYDADIVKVSIVGLGMRSHAGVAAKMFGSSRPRASTSRRSAPARFG